MFPKLRTVTTFIFATVVSTIILATAFLWTKSWTANFLKSQGFACEKVDWFYSGTKCMFSREKSAIALGVAMDEPWKCLRTILLAPRRMTLSYDFFNATEFFNSTTELPVTHSLNLEDIEYSECDLEALKCTVCQIGIWATYDWVPSKSTVIIWMMAFVVSVSSVIYVFHWLQKCKVKGAIVRVPNLKAGIPLSHLDVEDAETKRSYLNPSTWFKVWARKSGTAAKEPEGYY